MKSSRIQRVLSGHIVVVSLFCAFCGLFSQTAARAEDRTLSFYHIHTKESITITYKRNGQFDQEALQKLNYFMRDWRKSQVIKIDPPLFDLIWEIYQELGSKQPIHVICGFRSGATNEMLRHTRGGQARFSKHITGQAIDLEFPDVSIKQLRNSALIRERGGVGYYPTSSIPFVHVDTGNVRHWPRLPRQELAILFPNGNSQHVPSDGKPLTKADFRMALAQLQEKGGELPIALRARMNPGSVVKPSTVLASLAAPTPDPVEPAKPKPAMLMAASIAPIPKFGSEPEAPKPPSLIKPLISASAVQTSARADVDAFTRDILQPGAAPPPLQTEDDDTADYDDDHQEEETYQPFPILPFMSDTPVAEMDLSDSDSNFSLAKVHMLFTERKEMLDTRFQPGLQFAELFWAQRFSGAAVNTALRRIDRDGTPGPTRTAEQTAR